MNGIVCDATVLIYLARIGQLSLLDRMFSPVIVPQTVYQEVVDRGKAEGYPDALRIEEQSSSFDVRELRDELHDMEASIRTTSHLGEGESAALVMAIDLGYRCLTDDGAARRTAEAYNVPVGGTMYVLLQARVEESWTQETYISRLDALDDAGFHMSAGLYRDAREAGERLSENP